MPSPETNPVPAPAKRKVRIGRLLLALFLMVVVSLGGLAALLRYRTAAALKAHIAALQEAGEPLTPAEMEAYYVLPAGREDCTQLYLTAIAGLDEAEFTTAAKHIPIVGTENQARPPLPGEHWADLEQAEQFLNLHQPKLDMLHEAARRGGGGGARYPTDFDAGLNMPLDHLRPLRAAARMLQLEAFVRAHHQNARGAAQSLHAAWSVGGSLEYEPCQVSQWIRIALGRLVADQVQDFLPTLEFSDEDLLMFQGEFRSYRTSDSMIRCLRGERAMVFHAIEHLDDTDLDPSIIRLGKLFNNSEKLYYLEHTGKILAAARLPPPTSRVEMLARVDELDRQGQGGLRQNLGNLMTFMLLPATEPTVEAHYRALARYAATDAGLAAELFRRKHGKWPATLQELTPDFLPSVPIDPFDGQPLRFVAKGDDLLIYSIGKNDVDDGGQEVDLRTGEPDVVFKLTNRRPCAGCTSDAE